MGISLGINLLPADGKVCSFDCIYCECGFNEDHRPKQTMPTRQDVAEKLQLTLQRMKSEGQLPDVLTIGLSLLILLLPSMIITKINPARVMHFE